MCYCSPAKLPLTSQNMTRKKCLRAILKGLFTYLSIKNGLIFYPQFFIFQKIFQTKVRLYQQHLRCNLFRKKL